MAYEFLPTNFKDDIINAEINERRKYRMIQNNDGTVSFEDVTDYLQKGDLFGSGNVNDINVQINRINQVGYYTRYVVDNSMYRPELHSYSVSDMGYDEKLGHAKAVNTEFVQIDSPSSEWTIDLQPKKYYVFTLNYYSFVKKHTQDGDVSVQLIRLIDTGRTYAMYMAQLSTDSCSYSNSQFLDLIIYNFSDKVYRNFNASGFSLAYEIKTRLKKING